MECQRLANQFNAAYFGKNWTAANFKTTLNQVTLAQATQKIGNLNTILVLTYHIHYYVKGTTNVFKGSTLDIRDKYSFNHPNLNTETEWQTFLNTIWEEAKQFENHVKNLDDTILDTIFVEEKYGTYYRNITGIIEHTYYHVGQIALLKKLINVI